MSKTLDDAFGLSPDYLIWVASPMHFSDKDFVDLGRKVRRTGLLPAIGFITASSIEKARQLSSRTVWRDGGWAMAYGTWNGRDAMIEFGQAGGRKESLNPLSFRRALIENSYVTFEGHGGQSYFRFDAATTFQESQVPPLNSQLISAYSCNTFRFWTRGSIALAFVDQGVAAYSGYAYSPMPGYQMTGGLPFRHTWPGFTIGRLVQLQSAAVMQGCSKIPMYHLLGDPRLCVRETPSYRVLSDRIRSRDRVVELAAPADIVPIRIDGGARYETIEVQGMGRVWSRDPFYNARLQRLNVGHDLYLLIQHGGGPITIRLSDKHPVSATAIRAVLSGVDLNVIVYPNSDLTSTFAMIALGIGGFVFVAVRRRPGRTVVMAAIFLGAAFAVAGFAYASVRIGLVDIVSTSRRFQAWPAVAPGVMTAFGALVFLAYRSNRSRVVAVAVSGLGFWGPTILWIAGIATFNLIADARIGSPIYNYAQGLLTLIGAIAFTACFASSCVIVRRMVNREDNARDPAGIEVSSRDELLGEGAVGRGDVAAGSRPNRG
ncbi:MAG: hypothetical protein EHM61_25280 [Acidobacteria bacterium]|nr:MAG: hypothetical protein EHM61_25280 [Acidobacteriota bacterium]